MPEKVESLEQAALTFFSENIGYEMDLTDEVWLKDAIRFAAERERQVWAEAAKIAEEMAGDSRQFATQTCEEQGTQNYLYSDAVAEAEILDLAATNFRARGEQVK